MKANPMQSEEKTAPATGPGPGNGPGGGQALNAPQVVTQIAPPVLTLAEVRAKLESKSGKRFWKNLDELAETPEFHLMMER